MKRKKRKIKQNIEKRNRNKKQHLMRCISTSMLIKPPPAKRGERKRTRKKNQK